MRKTTVPRFLDELEEAGARWRREQQQDVDGDSADSLASIASSAEDPMYIFGNIDASKENGLIVGEPTVTLGQKFSSACRPGVTQLYVGGPGSGSPVHWHNDAVNYAVSPASFSSTHTQTASPVSHATGLACILVMLRSRFVQVHGTKLWTMLPPPHAVYSRRHASVDAVKVPIEAAARNQSGSVLRCVQHPGDLIYVPDGWCVGATKRVGRHRDRHYSWLVGSD
eukprot:COSAG02_NODE_3090_length_7388_cov_7.725614_9_plen_225_part_00